MENTIGLTQRIKNQNGIGFLHKSSETGISCCRALNTEKWLPSQIYSNIVNYSQHVQIYRVWETTSDTWLFSKNYMRSYRQGSNTGKEYRRKIRKVPEFSNPVLLLFVCFLNGLKPVNKCKNDAEVMSQKEKRQQIIECFLT